MTFCLPSGSGAKVDFDQDFSISLIGSVNTTDSGNGYVGFWCGTQTNGTLTAAGIAVVITATNNVQLQVHDGSDLATTNVDTSTTGDNWFNSEAPLYSDLGCRVANTDAFGGGFAY